MVAISLFKMHLKSDKIIQFDFESINSTMETSKLAENLALLHLKLDHYISEIENIIFVCVANSLAYQSAEKILNFNFKSSQFKV